MWKNAIALRLSANKHTCGFDAFLFTRTIDNFDVWRLMLRYSSGAKKRENELFASTKFFIPLKKSVEKILR